MKVKVRTLTNVETEIEVQNTDTITRTKELVHEKLSDFAPGKQVLIHAGTVLVDSKCVGDYHIKAGDRLVVMQSKKTTLPTEDSKKASEASAATPAAASTPAATSATSATAAVASNESAAADAASQQPQSTTVTTTTQSTEQTTAPSGPTTQTTTTTTTTETTSEARTAGENPLSDGANVENLVEQIVSMGFPRSDVEIALQAAFLNPDRAVEYLMNGIPPELIAAAAPPTEGPSDAPMQMPATTPGAGGEAPTGNDSGLSSIRRHPLFGQMRRAIQANPELLPQMLASIMQQNPALGHQITENRDEFLQLLGESDDEEGTGSTAHAGDGTESGGGPGSIQIRLTQAEIEAVQRLEALGFRREMAVQAYIACEKNEEFAANWLFDNIADFDEAESA